MRAVHDLYLTVWRPVQMNVQERFGRTKIRRKSDSVRIHVSKNEAPVYLNPRHRHETKPGFIQVVWITAFVFSNSLKGAIKSIDPAMILALEALDRSPLLTAHN